MGKLLMPFVEGLTGAMIPTLISRSTALSLNLAISELLYRQIDNSSNSFISKKVFLEKLDAIIIIYVMNL